MPMTTLELRVLKYMDGSSVRLGAVADIIRVDTSREKPASAYLRDLVLPIVNVGDEFAPFTVSVEPGHYFVQATLPSGEILTQEIDAEGPERVKVDLVSEDSPHEWLGKLQIAGAVPSSRRLKLSRSLGVVPVARPMEVRTWWLKTVTSETRFNDWLNSDAAVDDHAPSLFFGSLIAAGPLASVYADEQYEKFEIMNEHSLGGPSPPSPSLAKLLGKDTPPGDSRYYLALEDGTGIRALAVLPLPWPMPIEIVLREPAPGSCFAESPVQPVISVDDPEVAGLLGYLGRRDLQRAEAVLGQAYERLLEKLENPFAAAAGAYILLAADGLQGSPSKDWWSWIKNLANWFAFLPDGSIQLAWLKLNSINEEVGAGADGAVKVDAIVAEARGLLLHALMSGAPLYSAGVRLLVGALTLVANHEEYRGKHKTLEGTATTRALMLARWLSRRTDPSQAFTAIRI